jgi:hypothetical protein
VPYSVGSDLPSNVKKLSDKKQRQWVHVWNATFKKTGSEERAFKAANAVASKKDYYDSYSYDSYKKLPRDSDLVNYKPLGANGNEGCASCHYFISPDRCYLVEGEISPTGLSDLYLSEDEAKWEVPPIAVQIVKEQTPWQQLVETIKGWATGGAAGERSLSPVTFYKQRDGGYRVLLTVSNQFQDRAGDIFSEAAHKEFVSWVDETGFKPEIQIWHAGSDSAIGQADFVDYINGFLVASGPVYEGKEEVVERLADQELGASHGFLGWFDKDNVALKYRSWEFTILPSFAAGNVWTDSTLVLKGDDVKFSDTKRAFLKQACGVDDATVTAWETATEHMQTTLQKAGISFKDAEMGDAVEQPKPPAQPPPQPAPPAKEGQQPNPPAGEASPGDGNQQSGSGAPQGPGTPTGGERAATQAPQFVVLSQEQFAQLVGGIKALEGQVQAATKSLDDAVADKFTAEVSKLPQGFVASKSDGNVVSEESKKQSTAWFGEIIGQQVKEVGGVR